MATIDIMSDSTGKSIVEKLGDGNSVAGAIAEKLDTQNILLTAIAGKDGGLPVKDWGSVQAIVRMGLAPKVFSIGDQLVCNHETYGELVWDIIGFDHDVPMDSAKKHSMTIQLHDCIGDFEFDAAEALYQTDSGLGAGTYNFTLLSGYEETLGGGKTYSFTLTIPLPAGGQIVFPWTNSSMASATKISTYAKKTDTTPIETVAVTEGAQGQALALSNSNHTHKVRFGSNRWKESAIRQWLNSDANANAWWKPQHSFDRPTSYIDKSGFLNGIDKDFLSVIGKVTKRTVKNTITDGGGVDDLSELFFLLSKSEVFGGNVDSVEEGAPYPYYEAFSDLSAIGEGDDVNRIKYKNGNIANWFLRSCHVASGATIRGIYQGGNVGYLGAGLAQGIAPACNII